MRLVQSDGILRQTRTGWILFFFFKIVMLTFSLWNQCQTNVRYPEMSHTNVVPKIRNLADLSDFICHELTVFSQQGWEV